MHAPPQTQSVLILTDITTLISARNIRRTEKQTNTSKRQYKYQRTTLDKELEVVQLDRQHSSCEATGNG